MILAIWLSIGLYQIYYNQGYFQPEKPRKIKNFDCLKQLSIIYNICVIKHEGKVDWKHNIY